MKAIFSLLILAVAPLAAGGTSPSDTNKDQKNSPNKQIGMSSARENSMENRENRSGNRGNYQREQNLDQRQDNIEER